MIKEAITKFLCVVSSTESSENIQKPSSGNGDKNLQFHLITAL